MNVPMRSIETIAASVRQALDQIEVGTGVNLHRGRLRTYLQHLDAAAAGQAVGLPSLCTAVLESADIEAAAALRPAVLARVRPRLRRLATGPLDPDGEHDAGRDLAFELATAAQMLAVDQDVDLENPSDVVLSARGHRILIECKRPTSAAAFRRRLIEGYEQLSDLRRAGHAGFGVIAVDLGLLVNPGNGILPAASRDEAIASLYGHILRCFQLADRDLQRARRNVRADAGVHMLIFRLRCLVGIANGPPSVAQVWQAQPMVPLDSPEFAEIYRAMSRLPNFTPEILIIAPAAQGPQN